MKRMRYVLPLVIAGVAASAAVAGPKKPVAQWTCADFIAIDDQFKPKVVYWATGYAKGGKTEARELDIEGIEKLTPMIIAACEKEPRESFWKKLKGEWHKAGHETKSEMEKMKEKM